MCGSTPPAPTPPPATPEVPRLADPSVRQAGARERRNQRYAKGRSSTILTQGLNTAGNVGQTTVLGGAG